jgi:hypothetical protein
MLSRAHELAVPRESLAAIDNGAVINELTMNVTAKAKDKARFLKNFIGTHPRYNNRNQSYGGAIAQYYYTAHQL